MFDIEALTDLTIRLSRGRLTPEEKQLAICRCVHEVVTDANRVSLWQFNQDKSAIHCLLLMVNGQIASRPEDILREHAAPYFDAMLTKELIVASDSRTHPDTACFADTYSIPNNIFSLLDFIFHDNFRPFGIICCEREGSPVSWKEHQIAQLKRVAGVSSMFYADNP